MNYYEVEINRNKDYGALFDYHIYVCIYIYIYMYMYIYIILYQGTDVDSDPLLAKLKRLQKVKLLDAS